MVDLVQVGSPPQTVSAVILDYLPNDNVYLIDTCTGDNEFINQGTVVSVRAEVNITEDTILYDVRLANSNTVKVFAITDIFPDKTSALTEYANRV